MALKTQRIMKGDAGLWVLFNLRTEDRVVPASVFWLMNVYGTREKRYLLFIPTVNVELDLTICTGREIIFILPVTR